MDGIVGPATTAAPTDFAASHDIEGFHVEPNYDSIMLTPEVLEVFWLLELPQLMRPSGGCRRVAVTPVGEADHARYPAEVEWT